MLRCACLCLLLTACWSQGSVPPRSAAGDSAAISATPEPHAIVSFGINTGNDPGLNLALRVAGGSQQRFLFDTGSSGFWVYPNALGKSYTTTTYTVTNSYGSGIVYNGTVVYATVDFGNGLVTTSIPVVRVDSASCENTRPNCPAHPSATHCPGVNPKKRDAGILCLEAGRKLFGTFGADLEPTLIPSGKSAVFELYNAIFAIQKPWANAFIVSSGELQIGPRSLLGFALLPMTPKSLPSPMPNGAKGWKRDVTLCYTVGKRLRGQCYDTLFDTGAFDINFQATVNLPLNTKRCGFGLVTKGVAFTLAQKNGATLSAFPAGYVANWNAVRTTSPKPSSTPQVNTGFTFYNHDEILFDARKGRVGLRPLVTPGRIAQTGCTGV